MHTKKEPKNQIINIQVLFSVYQILQSRKNYFLYRLTITNYLFFI